MPGASRRFFDLWSRVYDIPVVQALTYRPVQDAVFARVRDRRPQRILDVGCGTGLLTKRLARELAVPVTGIDYSIGMLEAASGRHAGVSWVQADAMALPLRDEVADTLVCTESFHWYADQERALREFARVLVPGGLVAISYSVGARTPIWVPPRRLQRGLEQRGFAHVADFAAGPGLAGRRNLCAFTA